MKVRRAAFVLSLALLPVEVLAWPCWHRQPAIGQQPAESPRSHSDWTCAPEGRACTFAADCCSKKCVDDPKLGKVCKPAGASWTCAPEGTSCTFSTDCCSKTCVDDPKIGKVCKPSGASWTCQPEGRTCTFNNDCCSKNCVDDPKLGKVCKPHRR